MGKHYDHPMQRMNISTEVENSSSDKDQQVNQAITDLIAPVPTYELGWAAKELGWGLDDDISFCPDKDNDRIIVTRIPASETN